MSWSLPGIHKHRLRPRFVYFTDTVFRNIHTYCYLPSQSKWRVTRPGQRRVGPGRLRCPLPSPPPGAPAPLSLTVPGSGPVPTPPRRTIPRGVGGQEGGGVIKSPQLTLPRVPTRMFTTEWPHMSGSLNRTVSWSRHFHRAGYRWNVLTIRLGQGRSEQRSTGCEIGTRTHEESQRQRELPQVWRALKPR